MLVLNLVLIFDLGVNFMENNNYIHPTAIIEKNVLIGDRASVWHHCHVRQDSAFWVMMFLLVKEFSYIKV